MGAIRDFLDSVGRTKTPYTGSAIPGPPPADTASAEDKAKFEESVRKYQLDRQAYEQYNTELNNRLRNFNPYADPQYRIASTTPPAGATSVSVPTPAAPTPPTQLRAPTYGAISQFANLTPQQQGELYLQQRGIGYTDADIRKATAAQVGTPSEEMMANIYKTAYPQYTQAIESQYGSQFNRSGYGTGAGQIDYPGFNYYINQLSTGAVTPATLESAIRGGAAAPATTSPLTPTTPTNTTPTTPPQQPYDIYTDWMQDQQARDAASAGGGGGAARGGYIKAYAGGGQVRTHYQAGGETEIGSLDPNMSYGQMYGRPGRNRSAIMAPQIGEGGTPQAFLLPPIMPSQIGEGGTLQAEITPPPMPPQIGEGGTPQPLVGPTAEPTASTQGAATPAGGGSLQDMLARYMRASTSGGSELADARRRYQAESDAFYGLIRQMAERGESPTSRAEMYFRLASAFGSPTRTGSMGETLSKVGEQMSEYTKGRRADEAERRNLMVQAQQARMAGAREDLTTTRALAAQEATERRALNAAMLQEYIRSGRPQSRAGQMAIDAGLTPGTQAFQDYVRRHSELDIQRTEQLIQAQNENIALRRDAADRLSATEIKMADETTQNISSARDNAILLREAIRLNPNASPSNLTEGVITDLLARLGSTDPLVVNTRDIRNILNRLTLGSLKETFPGSISNDERTALAAVSGVTAASREERARIMQRASDALDRIIERNQEHLRKIRTGEFGRIDRTQGGTQ